MFSNSLSLYSAMQHTYPIASWSDVSLRRRPMIESGAVFGEFDLSVCFFH